MPRYRLRDTNKGGPGSGRARATAQATTRSWPRRHERSARTVVARGAARAARRSSAAISRIWAGPCTRLSLQSTWPANAESIRGLLPGSASRSRRPPLSGPPVTPPPAVRLTVKMGCTHSFPLNGMPGHSDCRASAYIRHEVSADQSVLRWMAGDRPAPLQGRPCGRGRAARTWYFSQEVVNPEVTGGWELMHPHPCRGEPSALDSEMH